MLVCLCMNLLFSRELVFLCFSTTFGCMKKLYSNPSVCKVHKKPDTVHCQLWAGRLVIPSSDKRHWFRWGYLMSYQAVLWQGFLCSVGLQELVSVSQTFLAPPVSAEERQRRDGLGSPLPPPCLGLGCALRPSWCWIKYCFVYVCLVEGL